MRTLVFVISVALTVSLAAAPAEPAASVKKSEKQPSKKEVVKREQTKAEALAEQAQTRIQGNKEEMVALTAAVRANNTAEVAKILARNGFDPKSLKIAVHHQPGTANARLKWLKVRITGCCPLEGMINIEITF
jgi:polyphosphate kinase 2 (PPK2 family)